MNTIRLARLMNYTASIARAYITPLLPIEVDFGNGGVQIHVLGRIGTATVHIGYDEFRRAKGRNKRYMVRYRCSKAISKLKQNRRKHG